MKRAGNIYQKILKKENIRKSILLASKRKRKRDNVKKILNNLPFFVDQIYEILKNKSYNPSPYAKVLIHDATRKKQRIIFKQQFYPDQIIHWCVMQIIQPLLEKGMYDFTCASIPNRGVHYGAKYIRKILTNDKKNTKYALKLDVKNFYPSIDKEIMKKKFRKIIKDREILELLDKIVESSEEGLPIGNYTSQWFANFYLQDIDHYIKEQLHIKYYIRYMDDMLLFHRNKKELHKVKNNIEAFLNKEGLKLKENWQLFKVESRPIDFLGYRFYRTHTTLRRSNFLRIKRRARRIYKKKKINYKDAAAMVSYNGWLKHSDSYMFNQKYIKPYVSIEKCKGVIRNESTKYYKTS